MRIRSVLLIGLISAFLPMTVAAQDGDNSDNFLFLANKNYQLPAGESIDAAVIASADVYIAGTVNDFLMVIDGTATVTGRVDSDLVVINGTLRLDPGADVENVTLIRSDLVRDPSAVVRGDVNERSGFSFGWGSALFSFLFWTGSTIVVLAAGLLFAALGSAQVIGAGRNATERVGESIVSAAIVWVGLPIIAIAAFFTLIGIPVGLAIFFVLLPALGFLGYLVIGTRIGTLLVDRRRPLDPNRKPYLAAVVGLLLLQVIALVPVVGGLIVFLAALYGAGALAFYAFQGWRGRRVTVLGDGHQPVPTMP